MDNIIDELIYNYKLSDFEALIVTGFVGVFAQQNIEIKEIYDVLDNKLKPIINKIINN